MDTPRRNPDPPPLPRGMAGDIVRAKESSLASAQELREFVSHFKGKSPQEVLGLVAQSRLMRDVATATVWCTILMAAMTFGPYYMNKLYPPPPKPVATVAPKPKAAEPAPAPATAATGTAAAGSPAPAPTATATAPMQPSDPNAVPSAAAQMEAVKKMGLDEVKQADPNFNPLENRSDDLLKDPK